MRAKDTFNPRNRLEEGSLQIFYTSPGGSWSVAEMIFDDSPRIGYRWNGDIANPDDKGNPRSHGQETWFVLPDTLGMPVASLAKTFRRGYG